MKYRLTEKIGSGGMAEVFRAVGEGPEGFERPFVIKRIHPHLSEAPEFVRMFVDEAKISARLIHPNIVQVFEFAHQDGSYYIVMEPVEGIDMGWFRRRRADHRHELLPTTFVAEIGRQACRGLDFAHTLADAEGKPLGIVHRDVTPPNIMVAWNGTVKILDFGIARAAQALRTNLTDAGMVKGKMSYLAPELLDGKTADARSDVFSLGAVLHELLCGKQLFAGETDIETLRLVKDMPIPRPSSINPGVKPALDSVVMRALERDPAERYQSASQMGDDLEALVLRKSYSPRALARKARELVDQEGTPAPVPIEVPVIIGEENSSRMVQELSGRAGKTTGKTAVPLAPSAARAPVRRTLWLALGAPALLAAALLGAAVKRPVVVTAAPSSDGQGVRTVRVALDSTPQGATVTSTAIRGGRPLGATPLVLDLPRSDAPVELLLTKIGFSPLPFKVIPHRDRDLLAKLDVAPPAVAVATLPHPGPMSKSALARSIAAARHGATPPQQRTPMALSPTTTAGGAGTTAAPARTSTGAGRPMPVASSGPPPPRPSQPLLRR